MQIKSFAQYILNNKRLLPLLSLLFMAYFVTKAILVPITNDEANTCQIFSVMSVKSILLFELPWPNNHILNTLAVKLMTFLFGLSQLTARIPNLIASIIFLISIIKISHLLSLSPIISLCTFLVFLADPHLNDYFSLARGYGMGVSFLAASIFFLLMTLKNTTSTNVGLSLIFSALSVTANFSFLITFFSISVVLFLICLNSLKTNKINFRLFLKLMLVLVTIYLGVAGFCYSPITRMIATNQYQYLGNSSFYSETFFSLYKQFFFRKYFSGINHYPPKVLFILFIIITFFGVFLHFKQKLIQIHQYSLFAVSCLLLLLTAAINIAQHKIAGTPYFSARFALVYVPLLCLVIGTGVSALFIYSQRAGILTGIFIIFGILTHLALSFNLSYFRECIWDKNNLEVVRDLKKTREQGGSNTNICLTTEFTASIRFYKVTQNLSWLYLQPYDGKPLNNMCTEYYYTYSEKYSDVPTNYIKIRTFDNDKQALFRSSISKKD